MNNEDDKVYQRRANYAIIIAGCLGIVGLLPLAISIYNDLHKDIVSIDYTSYVNILWSLSGLLLVFAAFMSQQQELRLQRNELKVTHSEMEMTREELKGQKEQFELQTNNMRKQGFENSLYNMLSLLKSSRDKWATKHTIRSGNEIKRVDELSGIENIHYIWNTIYALLENEPDGKPEEDIYNFSLSLEENWFIGDNFQHFELIEEILEYIKSEDHESIYLRLFFLQLTTSEILLARAYWITKKKKSVLKILYEAINLSDVVHTQYIAIVGENRPVFNNDNID